MIVFGALCLMASFGAAATSKELRPSDAQAIQVLNAAGSGGSHAQDKTCHGAGNCLRLLDRVGTKCKTWICNPGSDGKANCWCDL